MLVSGAFCHLRTMQRNPHLESSEPTVSLDARERPLRLLEAFQV
jgi:hypothetical protein